MLSLLNLINNSCFSVSYVGWVYIPYYRIYANLCSARGRNLFKWTLNFDSQLDGHTVILEILAVVNNSRLKESCEN